MPSVSTALAMAMIGDDYRYVGELGAGGGGTVMLARHVPMDRLVAVKAVTASSRSALARLRREGRVLAAMNHPSILKVYRLVEDGLVLALITEYLDGGNFEEALDEQRLSGRQVVDVLLQVGSALQAAHAAGIVHRDVKPTNVLLARDGRVVLGDFGLSRLTDEFKTQSAAITGTPLYMAPEQITRPDAESPALDVYSYGALTYRALSGRPPFVASNLKALAELHLSVAPEPLDEVRRVIPPSVSKIVLGMLAKNPHDRPALQQVAAALSKVRPEVWDTVLPQARTQIVRRTSLPNVAVSDALGGGTETTISGGTEGSDESGAAPSISSVPEVHAHPLTTIEQPVFRPKQTRRIRPAFVIAAAVLVGILLGLLVLLML